MVDEAAFVEQLRFSMRTGRLVTPNSIASRTPGLMTFTATATGGNLSPLPISAAADFDKLPPRTKAWSRKVRFDFSLASFDSSRYAR